MSSADFLAWNDFIRVKRIHLSDRTILYRCTWHCRKVKETVFDTRIDIYRQTLHLDIPFWIFSNLDNVLHFKFLWRRGLNAHSCLLDFIIPFYIFVPFHYTLRIIPSIFSILWYSLVNHRYYIEAKSERLCET